MGGLKMKLLDPMPPENSLKGSIFATEPGSKIGFNIRDMHDDIIHAEFDDEEELFG